MISCTAQLLPSRSGDEQHLPTTPRPVSNPQTLNCSHANGMHPKLTTHLVTDVPGPLQPLPSPALQVPVRRLHRRHRHMYRNLAARPHALHRPNRPHRSHRPHRVRPERPSMRARALPLVLALSVSIPAAILHRGREQRTRVRARARQRCAATAGGRRAVCGTPRPRAWAWFDEVRHAREYAVHGRAGRVVGGDS